MAPNPRVYPVWAFIPLLPYRQDSLVQSVPIRREATNSHGPISLSYRTLEYIRAVHILRQRHLLKSRVSRLRALDAQLLSVRQTNNGRQRVPIRCSGWLQAATRPQRRSGRSGNSGSRGATADPGLPLPRRGVQRVAAVLSQLPAEFDKNDVLRALGPGEPRQPLPGAPQARGGGTDRGQVLRRRPAGRDLLQEGGERACGARLKHCGGLRRRKPAKRLTPFWRLQALPR